jgi:predicted dehydrogenase
VADYGHSWAIQQTPGLTLTALCDPNPEALGKLAERFPDARTFTDPAEFFAFSEIDAVSVCTPAPLHREHVEAATARGLHILCEKPLAMTEGDIAAMIQAADKADVLLATALCYRFSPVAQAFRKAFSEGWIGDIRALRLVYLWGLHGKFDEHGVESPRRIGRFVEGGPLVDCGVHQLDLALWWTGSPVRSWQSAAAWIEEHESPGHVWLHLDHESGVHTCVEVSFSYGQTAKEPCDLFTYEAIGTEGVLRYDRNGWLLEARTSRGTHRLEGASEKSFHGMYALWRDCLEAGKLLPDMPTAHDGRLLTRIAREATEAARRSAILYP